MDDGDVAQDAHADVVRGEAADRHRPRGLLEELALVEQRSVRVRAEEIVGEDLAEPSHVAMLHGRDVVPIERDQRLEVASWAVALSIAVPFAQGVASGDPSRAARAGTGAAAAAPARAT
jgi:hypothetical protein